MKTSKNFGHAILKGLLMVLFLSPVVTSCFDDSELWEKIDQIEARLDSLEAGLNGQIQAFSDFLAGGDITISDCLKNADGSYAITLSNGTKFTMLPDSTAFSALVSYVELEGVKYWAAYNAEGKLIPLLGAGGAKIPVYNATPVVEERDGVYYLVVGNKEYVTGYTTEDIVSIFTSYQMNKDEAGQIYSATFTFGEDMSFTITVDGYSGFSFYAANGDKTSEHYVPYGYTVEVLIETPGVVDYVMQVPEGWKVKEKSQSVDGARYLMVTAPTKAVAEENGDGNLKVVAVLEGGKAVASTLRLTTNPFKTLTVTAAEALVNTYVGVDRFIYGVCAKDGLAEVYAQAEQIVKELAEQKAGYLLSDKPVKTLLADAYGEVLEPGVEYVLWAVPNVYVYGKDYDYELPGEDALCSFPFTYFSVELQDAVPTFDDASITIEMNHVAAFYGGTAMASQTTKASILEKINAGHIKPEQMEEGKTEYEYTGSAFTFPQPESNVGILLNPGAAYYTWVVPVLQGKTVYTEDDMLTKEFNLKLIEKGGEAGLSIKSEEVNCKAIKAYLESPKGKQVYYAFMTERNASKYPDNDLRAEYLLKNGKTLILSDKPEENFVLEEGLSPEETRILLAVAVDANGRYGEALYQKFKTKAIDYNTIKLSLNWETTTDKGSVGKLKATGGTPVKYVYWVGSINDENWIAKFDRNVLNVAQYIAICDDPENDPYLYNSLSTHSVASDGTFTVRGLYPDTQYNVVVVAFDADGKPSKHCQSTFYTMAVNLGTIVTKDKQEWKDAKAAVKFNWHADKFVKDSEYAIYAFDVTLPTELTAYVYCISDEYFEDNPKTRTMEGKIVDIENYCSRSYDAGRTVTDAKGEYISEPDWYDDSGTKHDGTLLNVYTFYVHGFPTNGFATYFSGSHAEHNCTSWENGACHNLAYAWEHITSRHTVDYYKQLVKNNRKDCNLQETIDKVAQDLFEAYYPYYKDAEPKLYINNGEPLYMEQHYGSGPDDAGNVVDDVYVLFKDAEGNYYEPMSFPVPNNF